MQNFDTDRRPACAEVSAGFSDERELSDGIINSVLLYIDDMSKLPPLKLVTVAIANAIDSRSIVIPVVMLGSELKVFKRPNT